MVTAASIQDRDGGRGILKLLKGALPGVRHIFADGGYQGQLIALAKRAFQVVVEVVKKPAEQIGFAVLPRRWVVERTFSWLLRWRRLVRDYERLPETHEAFVKWAMVGLMLKPVILLPRRRRGRAYEFDERRFLTHEQLARLLAEIPDGWRPFFDLLASTGLRISEAIALRIMDVDLDAEHPRIHVRRAIVDGQLTGPKSRHGRRTIPISHELANRLAALAVNRGETDLLFVGAQGAMLRPGNLRYRVMIPAAQRAGVPWARFHTLRHTCAALLIDAGASPLRLQRWMGHHSAAFTLDNYGHLIDDCLGPSLDLSDQFAAGRQPVG